MQKIIDFLNAINEPGNPVQNALFDDNTIAEILAINPSLLNFPKISRKDESKFKYSIIFDRKNTPFALYNPYRGTEETINSGAQGDIRIAQNLFTKEFCLVKICCILEPDRKLLDRALSNIIREMRISELYRCDFIHGFQHIIHNHRLKTYMFMQELPGEPLAEFDAKGLNSTQCLEIVYQFLLMLDSLSRKGIVHRDIHNENILIDSSLNVHLIDFGLAYEQEPKNLSGLDFDDIYTLIENLDLLSGFDGLKTLFKEKAHSCMKRTDADCSEYVNINIDDLIAKTLCALVIPSFAHSAQERDRSYLEPYSFKAKRN
ncbi:protein kinase [Candidatus Berkiella cookevillensis]|uniref:Protein kinase n=1 Tax=Candidatus Berkiella cookevillensis TaxID=437022 RepID=A0A0Q9YM05_9GAMM|nr:protein kinase [Candidatus Berkiella cookevillensis]MCS5707965.1 protein kinase [Candidatus Berkiella cookevillensis]